MKPLLKKSTGFLLTLVLAFLLCMGGAFPQASAAADIWNGTTATGFAGGSGSSSSPYQIATGAQLAYLAALANGDANGVPTAGVYYILTSDIDLNYLAWTPIGTTYFRGNFDGDGHVISNLSIGSAGTPDTSGKNLGLFGNASGCTIQNVGVENAAIYASSSSRIGGLAGQIVAFSTTPSTIKNCYTSGTVSNGYTSTAYAGGLAGNCGGSSSPDFTVILNCSSSVNVTVASASGRAGGLFGNTLLSNIRNCFATGNVSNQNTSYTGGLIGRNQSATISYAYWNGSASQSAGGSAQDPKRGIGTDDTGTATTTSKTSTELKEAAFVTLLNAHNESEGNWGIVSGVNGGYPMPFSAAPAISLDPATDKTFTGQIAGYGAQTAHSVTINNTGSAETGALTIGLSGTNTASFALSKTSITTIAAGGSDSFTVAPVTGLSPGTYTATVSVSGTSVTTQTFNVSFTVTAATYTITTNPTTLNFGSKVVGYTTAPDAQTVTVTNTGNSSVTVTLPTKAGFSITASTSLTLAPAGTVIVTIRPETGLAAGTYSPTLTFTTDHSTSANTGISFAVDAATYTITASPATLDFGSKVAGYTTAPDAQSVTITNTGNSSVTVTLPTNAAYDITTADSLTLAPTATASVSIRPVTGLGAGNYNPTLTFTTDHATSANAAPSFSVTTATYSITASPTSLDFGSKVTGYTTAPDAQTVTIKNTGNSSVTVTLPTNGAYDITTADSLTLAPLATASVSIRPVTGLGAGNYNPTLTFTTDHSTSTNVAPSFSVVAATYTITASPSTLNFGSKIEGYSTPPDAQTVTIKNTGNSSVTVTLPTRVGYSITASTSLTLAPNDTVVVTVQPGPGFPTGTYTPTLDFNTDHSTSVDVGTSFTVSGPTYTITASPTTLDFGSKVAGYSTPPDAQTVTIKNTGNSGVTVTLPTNAAYDITTSDSLTLAPGGTATVSIRPKGSLATGTYNPTLTFTTDHSTSADVAPSFSVGAATYTITASPTTLDFGSKVAGYTTPPDAQSVTIKNTGNSSVTVTLPTNAAYDITTTDSLTLAPSGTAAVSVRPKGSLATGTYNPTLTFSTDHSTSADVTPSFSVGAATYTMTVSPATLDFGTAVEGYATAPDAQTVTIKNTGNSGITVSLPTNAAYGITTADSLTLAPTATASVSIRPKASLPAGTYNPTLTFSSDHSTSADTAPSFTVDAALYEISASPASIDFGSETAGYAPVTAQTVTITNDGNKVNTLVQPSGVDFTAGTLSRTVLNPGDSATFTVKPNDGLAVGTYSEAIAVEGSDTSETQTDVTFTVSPVLYGITADGGDTYYLNTVAGLTFTSNGLFPDFTGVSVDGAPLTTSQYTAVSGSTVVTLAPGYLNTLAVGSHTMRVQFTDGYAEVTFNVLAIAKMPDTGDTQPITLTLLLLALSLAAIAAMLHRRKRRMR